MKALKYDSAGLMARLARDAKCPATSSDMFKMKLTSYMQGRVSVQWHVTVRMHGLALLFMIMRTETGMSLPKGCCRHNGAGWVKKAFMGAHC